MIAVNTIRRVVKLQHDGVLGNYGHDYLIQRLNALDLPKNFVPGVAAEMNNSIKELRRILIIERSEPQ